MLSWLEVLPSAPQGSHGGSQVREVSRRGAMASLLGDVHRASEEWTVPSARNPNDSGTCKWSGQPAALARTGLGHRPPEAAWEPMTPAAGG